MALLEIRNLSVDFPSGNGVMHAVDGVDLTLDAGDVLAPDLQSLTAAFERADVAVVQAATEYSNRDSLLHTAPFTNGDLAWHQTRGEAVMAWSPLGGGRLMERGTVLAPLYDALTTAVYPRLTDKMAMKIGGKYKFTEVQARHWERFAQDAGLVQGVQMLRHVGLRGLDFTQQLAHVLLALAQAADDLQAHRC